MKSIILRAIVLVVAIGVIGVCADTLRHRSFESGIVATTSNPEYLVRCEDLEFRHDITIAIVRVIDESPFPQFQAFRTASSRGPEPYLYLPATYGSAAGWLRFVHYEDLPDLVFNPKPNNEIHEAVLRVAFEPIAKLRSEPLNVDKVYLKFPGFQAFPVLRRVPLSQSQGMFTAIHNFIISNIPPVSAQIFFVLGAFAFCGIVVDSYREREMIVYRWKLRQLASKGSLLT